MDYDSPQSNVPLGERKNEGEIFAHFKEMDAMLSLLRQRLGPVLIESLAKEGMPATEAPRPRTRMLKGVLNVKEKLQNIINEIHI